MLPITAAVILTLSTFILFRQSVLNVGFEEIYPFRFLFKPLGFITNVWAEGLILLLGWLCFYEKTSRSILFITLIAILLSFSRGAYTALGIYLLLWFCLVKPIQEKLKLFILAASAISLITFLLPKETKTTLQIHHTASQRQSTEGRMLASTHALKMFQQHILLGNGTGQYTLAMDQQLNQDSRLGCSMEPFKRIFPYKNFQKSKE